MPTQVDIETLSDTVRRVLESHGLTDIETMRQHLEVSLHLEEGELVSQSEVIEALLEDVSGVRICPIVVPGLMLPISLRPTRGPRIDTSDLSQAHSWSQD
jgi:hypothetical protein